MKRYPMLEGQYKKEESQQRDIMKLENSYITLTNLRFHALHGVMPQEQVAGNDYSVSLRIRFDAGKAMLTDDVNDTINYAEVYQIVHEEMMHPNRLIEHVAHRIADHIVQAFPALSAIDIKLVKLNPPIGADCDGAGIELHLINDKTKP